MIFPNEALLVLSVAVIFSMSLVWLRLFGAAGLMCWGVIATLLANIEVLIVVRAFGMEQTLGNVLFASTFLTTDILSEIYGKKAADRAVYSGICAGAVFALISRSWLLYAPARSDWVFPGISLVFANTPRLVGVSLVVYAITQKLDVTLYHALWRRTELSSGDRRRFLWLRNNCATLVSQLLNAVLFNLGAFWGIYDAPTLTSICISTYVIYVFTSLLDTPFVYFARKIKHLPDKAS
jgi:uncharacterized integral membrane protein (TIGR00697 family)